MLPTISLPHADSDPDLQYLRTVPISLEAYSSARGGSVPYIIDSQLPPAIPENALAVTLPQRSSLHQLFKLSNCRSLRRLTADAPRFKRSDLEPVFAGTFAQLVVLRIRNSPIPIPFDAVVLFTALAHMPQLEDLSLTHLNSTVYDVSLPPPPFRLRHYEFASHSANPRGPCPIWNKGWTWPISTSAQTLRHLRIGLHSPNELQEASSVAAFESLRCLEVASHKMNGFRDPGRYARFIEQLQSVSRLWLFNLFPGPHIRTDIPLLCAAGRRPSVDISLTLHGSFREPEQHAELDAALADALRTAPSLRQLRSCVIYYSYPEELNTDTYQSTRAICATRRIAFLLRPSHFEYYW